MGIRSGLGAAETSGYQRQAAFLIRDTGRVLSQGFDDRNTGVTALVSSINKTIAQDVAYATNVATATSFVNTAKAAAANLSAQLLDMQALAIQGQSASGSSLADLNTLFQQKKAVVQSLASQANFNGTNFFATDTSASAFQVGATTSTSADMTVYGIKNSQINSLVASNNGTAAGAVAHNALLGEKVSVMIFGTATISAVAGTAGGAINGGSVITATTGTVVVNIGGLTYNVAAGQTLTCAVANGATLQYSSAVDLSAAAATPVVLTNGYFSGGTAAAVAADIALTTGAAGLGVFTVQSVFGGSDVTTSANATTASATIGGILAALNTTIVKLNAMDSSLNGYRDNISDTIRELGTTVESMQSTDVTDAMSDIARAQQEISYSMAVWQVQRKEENEAVRAMLSTVAG